MKTGFQIKFISFKQLGLLFSLLLSFQLQLHLLLAVPQNSMVAAVADHEDNIGRELNVKRGGEHETKAVGSGGGGASGGGEGGGVEYGSAGVGGGGTTRSTNRGGGALIPVYAAGSAAKRNHYHHHHGSSGGTVSCIGSSCLVLILFTSFLFVYSI